MKTKPTKIPLKATTVSFSEEITDEIKREAARSGLTSWTIMIAVLVREALDARKARVG